MLQSTPIRGMSQSDLEHIMAEIREVELETNDLVRRNEDILFDLEEEGLRVDEVTNLWDQFHPPIGNWDITPSSLRRWDGFEFDIEVTYSPEPDTRPPSEYDSDAETVVSDWDERDYFTCREDDTHGSVPLRRVLFGTPDRI